MCEIGEQLEERTWIGKLHVELTYHKEKLADIVFSTCPLGDLNVPLSSKAFTIWTSKRVYFPAAYDGCGWVDSVPRYPCNEEVGPIGE